MKSFIKIWDNLLFSFAILLILLILSFTTYTFLYRSCSNDGESQILATHKEFVSVSEFDDQDTKYYYATSTTGGKYVIIADLSCHWGKAKNLVITDIVKK